jgi:hypothetical protein
MISFQKEENEIIIYSEQVLLHGMFSPKVVQPNAWSHKAALVFECVYFSTPHWKKNSNRAAFFFSTTLHPILSSPDYSFVCHFHPLFFPPKAVSSFSFSPHPTTAAGLFGHWSVDQVENLKRVVKKKEKTSSTLHIQSPADIPFPNVFPKLLIKWPPSTISYRYYRHRVVKTNRDEGERYPTKGD